jgi:hypothetical protein
LRPKVRPPLSQEFAEDFINPRIFVVVCLNESAIGPRFKHSRIFMMKRFESLATKKMHLILRFPSTVKKKIADSLTPTLARLPASFTLKPQIATEKVANRAIAAPDVLKPLSFI